MQIWGIVGGGHRSQGNSPELCCFGQNGDLETLCHLFVKLGKNQFCLYYFPAPDLSFRNEGSIM